MRPRRPVFVGAMIALLAVAVTTVLAAYALTAPRHIQVSASSSAGVGQVSSLLDNRDSLDRTARWVSDGEADGAWIELEWRSPTIIHSVAVDAPTDDSGGFESAALTFEGGDSILLTADETGAAQVAFPAREVSRVRFTFDGGGSDAVSLAGISIGDAAVASVRSEIGSATVSASSSSDTSGVEALTDGNVQAGDWGAAWEADAGDSAPWVKLEWDSLIALASVQVAGPERGAFDPRASAATDLHGTLIFSDGSTVPVSGIAGAQLRPTTVAFMPRYVTSVTLELKTTIDSAVLELREFAAFERGQTPPRPPFVGTYSADPTDAPECAGRGTADAADPGDDLSVVCPQVGAAIEGSTNVIMAGSPGEEIVLRGLTRDDSATIAESVIASGAIGSDGFVNLQFDAEELPQGPTAVRAEYVDRGGSRPVHLQLVNRSGWVVPQVDSAPNGMTLQWDEDFDRPLSASKTGTGAEYTASKPDRWGPSEFGEASFVDPASGPDSLVTVDDNYLRIRAQPRPAGDVGGWGQRFYGGSLSSMAVGGAGFAAQYGYFEARMLGAPGPGAWSAFWLLDSEDATSRGEITGEIDIVELYGHETIGGCFSLHNYVDGEDVDDVVDCSSDTGFHDWAMQWHNYGARVSPGSVTYYIDGVEVAQASGLRSHRLPYYFMTNLALGGGWPIELDATAGTADLYVDWIRVYT